MGDAGLTSEAGSLSEPVPAEPVPGMEVGVTFPSIALTGVTSHA